MKCLYCKRKAGLYGVCEAHLKTIMLLRKLNDPRKPKGAALRLTE